MTRAFISYHHENDQYYKEELVRFAKYHSIFTDWSVDTGGIPDWWDDQAIRREIRDNYLRDSTVTILLVGQETKYRKHIDWEIYSSMYDGAVSRKSGILVVQLPGAHNNACFCSHANEKSYVYPDCGGLHSIETKSGFEGKYPFLPDRIIDNLYAGGSNISVTTWERISNDSANLRFLVDVTASARATAIYDLSRDMRRNNGSPQPSPTFRLI